MNRRQWLYAGTAATAGALGLGLAWHRPAHSPAAQAFWTSQFERIDGPGHWPASRWAGRPLLLNFWATWCAPCVRELPEIQQFLAAQPGWQGLALAIDRKEAVQDFLAKLPLQIPLALGGVQGLELGRQLGNTQGGLPFSVVFDARGEVYWRRLGALQAGELDAVARALAAGQPAPEAGKTGA